MNSGICIFKEPKSHLEDLTLHLQVAESAFQVTGIAFPGSGVRDLEIPNLDYLEMRFSALLGVCDLEIPNLDYLEMRFSAPLGVRD